MHGDPNTALEPPEIADDAAARARPHSPLLAPSPQSAERPAVSAEVPTSRPDVDAPAEAASDRPAVGQFRVFKPPAGVSTWDSSPFIESPFTAASAQARPDRLPLAQSAQGTCPVSPAWRRSRGHSWPCCSSRPHCPCGSHGLIPRSRTRRSTCGLGTWSGPGGCTIRRCQTSRPTSRARQSFIRLWAPWPIVSGALPLPACCLWVSCSASRPSCGPRPPGCTGSEQHYWLRLCSPLSLAHSSSARSRHV